MAFRGVVTAPVRRILGHYGLDVRRRPNLGRFLASRAIDVFLDVGANSGQTGAALRQQGYRGRIVSFEPVRDVFLGLKQRADRDGNWDAHNFALGSSNETRVINVSRNTLFSSMLTQTEEAARFNVDTSVVHRETVTVRRLDDMFSEFVDKRVFLKVVTQGSERDVLAGGRNALERIAAIELILPIVQIYAGNWSFAEAITSMQELGFVLAQTGQEVYAGETQPILLELYCIFRRAEEHGAAFNHGRIQRAAGKPRLTQRLRYASGDSDRKIERLALYHLNTSWARRWEERESLSW